MSRVLNPLVIILCFGAAPLPTPPANPVSVQTEIGTTTNDKIEVSVALEVGRKSLKAELRLHKGNIGGDWIRIPLRDKVPRVAEIEKVADAVESAGGKALGFKQQADAFEIEVVQFKDGDLRVCIRDSGGIMSNSLYVSQEDAESLAQLMRLGANVAEWLIPKAEALRPSK